MRPAGAIWADVVGPDRTAAGLVLAGAGAAAEGAIYVLGAAADRVVGWTYKPVRAA